MQKLVMIVLTSMMAYVGYAGCNFGVNGMACLPGNCNAGVPTGVATIRWSCLQDGIHCCYCKFTIRQCTGGGQKTWVQTSIPIADCMPFGQGDRRCRDEIGEWLDFPDLPADD